MEPLLLTAVAPVSKRYDYPHHLRISGADLEASLFRIGRSFGWFAKHYGVPRPRVLKWVSDSEDIPPAVVGWLAGAELPGGVQAIEAAMSGRVIDLRSADPEDSD